MQFVAAISITMVRARFKICDKVINNATGFAERLRT